MKRLITFLVLFSIQLFAGIGVGKSPIGSLTIIANTTDIPSEYILYQNYPNPFNPSTIISYSIPSPSQVILSIYDVLGNKIATLVNDYQVKGQYEINFRTDGLSNGVYYYKIHAGSYTSTKKMLLLK